MDNGKGKRRDVKTFRCEDVKMLKRNFSISVTLQLINGTLVIVRGDPDFQLSTV